MILKDYKQFLNESKEDDLDEIIRSKGLKLSHVNYKNGEMYFNAPNGIDVVINNKLVEDGKLRIKFNHVSGDFKAMYLDLTSMEGFPKIIDRNCYLSNNQITSLVGGPKTIGKHFVFQNNPITNLEGFPESVARYIDLGGCMLTSIEGLPTKVHDDLHLERNNITNLIGAPDSIDGAFVLTDNKELTSLEGFPGIVIGNVHLVGCDNLKSLYGITNRVHKVKPPKHLQVEADFINEYEMAVLHDKNYWKELLEYVLKNSKDIDGVNWPEGMINDDIRRSAKSLNKFKI
jgi:Leucine-rich repeat (LRR) protein